MNKRKLFNIASIIIILIYLMVFNYYFYFENKSSFIIPYLFIILIQYIYTIKNKDKYFSLDSVNNVLMFTNISLIFIAIIDFAYDKLLLSFDYGGIFTNLAAIPFVIAYILLIIWLLTLNKEKTKLKKFDIVKIINVVIYIAVVSFGVFNNDGYGYQQYLMVPLILAVIQLFSLLNKNFTRIIQNKYSIILLLTNILLIIGIDSYIFAILASVLSLILIYQYINKKKVLKL